MMIQVLLLLSLLFVSKKRKTKFVSYKCFRFFSHHSAEVEISFHRYFTSVYKKNRHTFCNPSCVFCVGMIQRMEVVLSVLGELQEATECMGLDALTKVAVEVEQALASFCLPSALCSEISSWLGIDAVAHRLYPADAPAGLLPLVCKGEGNMLFEAASMLLVGSTCLSLELQVRTVVEMLLWKRYYLCGMIDSKVMLY